MPEALEALADDELRQELRVRMARFKDLVYSDVPKSRQALRKLLHGPIRYIPGKGKAYELRGKTQLGALLPPTSVTLASPRGFEPLLPA